MKYANPAGAVSRRLIESIHGRYIDELHETMGWDRESVVEMLLLSDGDVEKLKATHQQWMRELPPIETLRVHDSMRSFLAILHRDHDREQELAKELRRRLVEANYAEFIAGIVGRLRWKEADVVTCLLLSGSPDEFETEFAKWFEDGKRVQAGPVGAFAGNFINYLRRRTLPTL